jgi:hypothetical protein
MVTAHKGNAFRSLTMSFIYAIHVQLYIILNVLFELVWSATIAKFIIDAYKCEYCILNKNIDVY